MSTIARRTAVALAATVLLTGTPARATDWINPGGNPAHDGLVAALGPVGANQLWSNSRPSLIGWQPLTEGDRVFIVRQTGFPPNGEPNGSPVVCLDLNTGQEIWITNVPYNAGDWTTWVGGVRDGRVYASRGGNGASVAAPLYCLDAATGHTLWVSTVRIDAGAYEGVIFAPNGDPIVCSFRNIWRFNSTTGAQVWSAGRTASVSGNCPGATFGDAIYVVDAVAGGNVVVRYDLATGARLYAGPTMSGFTIQNGCFVGRDGSIYVSRTQNAPSTDYFYGFKDSGAAITEKWHVPARWTTSSEFAVGPDGSIYMIAPGNMVARLDPDTGNTLNASAPIAADTNLTPRMACDGAGHVYVSNGGFNTGRLYVFNADLTPLWDLALPAVNIGTPAIGRLGTLIAATPSNVSAYRTLSLHPGDLNCDGVVDFLDINPFVLALSDPAGYEAAFPDCPILNGDCNNDGLVNFEDINPFVALLTG